MGLSGKRVVVIGGTSGIGFAVAQGAAADGASIVVGSSSARKVAAAQERLPGAQGLAVDVKNEASVAAFFEQVGPFDHLVFTAGDWERAGGGALASLDVAAAAGAFSVRFWGAVTAIKHAQKLIREHGSVTLTDGMIANRPRKGAAISTAMAGAVEHLVLGLVPELAPIRINGVCPGLVQTEVWNAIPAEMREERLKRMTERLPVKRVAQPAEVAEAYLYLMRCGYTTGQVLRVDGGQSAL
jgi:NAD(P)-dependent dehydrogenase (short-subunit alcohol dehydrogenase family)